MSDSRRRRPVFEALEPRILYSADLAALGVAGPLHTTAGGADAAWVAPATLQTGASVSSSANADASQVSTGNAQPATAAATPAIELAVIDHSVAGADLLLADIERQQLEGRGIRAVLVEAGDDGIAATSSAIADIVESGALVSAIHLIGHGDGAGTTLGGTRLDIASLRSRSAEFAGWSASLSAEADLLLYGCDIAGAAEGRTLAQGLSVLTGADVAASDDLTGAAALGGDWSLEFTTGAIDAELALSDTLRDGYDAVLASFTVTNTNDSGAGSLRQAITSANLNGGVDIIDFAIGGGGVQTINLLSALPTINDQVTINGITQLGWSGTPLIELNGTSAGALSNGLSVSLGGTNTVINGLIINRFGGNGILVDGADSVEISGNYIGTSNTGLADQGNALDGIQLQNGATNTEIGGLASWQRNVISGNNNAGIAIDGATTTGTLILGNYVGLGADGLTAIGNTHDGIHLQAAAFTTIGSATDPNGRNVISSNVINGIGLDAAVNTTIVGNYIGTSASGLLDRGNAMTGVLMNNGAQDNVVGGTTAGARNVISGNNENGVTVNGVGSQANQIIGNYIGVDATGAADLGNALVGIAVGLSADNNVIGSAGGGRNVISGNDQYGVRIVDAGTDNNLIQNNLIGLNAAGNAAIGNGNDGIRFESGGAMIGNVIGGTTAGLGNVISGNAQSGIDLESLVSSALIAGNYIGTDITGLLDIGNVVDGIFLDSATNVTVGGTTSAARNVISGNGNRGINSRLGFGHVIEGNYIGVGSDGLTALGNGYDGVAFDATNASRVGGTVAGTGNIIANQTGTNADGIFLTNNATSISILGNSIYNSFDAGIEFDSLVSAGTDALDADTGNNNLQNFPVLSGASTTGTSTTITGTLGAAASTTYRVEFFANRPGTQDLSGYGEGRYFLGSTSVTTDAGGSATINAILTNVRLANGDRVSATATVHTGGSNYTDTSEFSANVIATSYIVAVTNTSDVANGDTSSITALALSDGGDGVSLREAITAANNTSNAGGVNEIWFAIGTSGGPQTIAPGAPLPSILDGVIIDGRTQPGFSGTPLITLDGNNLGTSGLQLGTGSSGSTIRGLIVRDFLVGISISSASGGNTIAGNYIGRLDATGGDAGAGEGNNNGIVVAGAGNAIGGTSAADRNVISGNADDGIEINGEVADNNTVQGNYIGVNVAGTAQMANGGDGIFITGGGDNNLIGGPGLGAGNLIAAGALIGIEVDGASSGNLIQGNRIGTDAAGTANWGSNEDGIVFENGAFDNLVGGTTAGAENVIAFSGQGGVFTSGIRVAPTAGGDNSALRNTIYSSVGAGLDLGASGVSANDDGDGDSGGNDQQNYPVISNASLFGADLYVSFSLDTDLGNAQYRIDFYGNTAGLQDPVAGEARESLGSLDITTNGTGDYSISNVFLASIGLAIGDYVTATATQIDNPAQVGLNDLAAYGSTSEFAANRQITTGNLAPVIAFGESNKAYSENAAAVILDTLTTVSDSDSLDFDTGHLVVTLTANAQSGDQLAVRNQGIGVGQIGISGVNISYGGITIGSFSGGLGVVPLDITLNSSATPAAVQALMRNIVFDNLDEDPVTTTRTVQFVLSDGDGGTSVAITKQITLTGDTDLWVSTTADSSDGNTSSVDALLADRGADGRISLREAITAANNTAGTQQINFDIPEALVGGAHTIALTSELPAITDVVDINGALEPDFLGTPVVELDGSLAGGAAVGLTLGAGSSGSTLHGLVINRFHTGISIQPDSSGNLVTGNRIGTSVDGLLDRGNTQNGIYLQGHGNTIGGDSALERNLISGNDGYGIYMGSSNNNVVTGNWIGVDASGNAALGNTFNGIYVGSSAGNQIGGLAAGERNVIAAHGDIAVRLEGGTNHTIQGNYIGVGADGTTALPNLVGVSAQFGTTATTIGGTTASAGNLILNNGRGIVIDDASTSGIAVLRNRIDNSGTLAIDLGNNGVTANDAGDADTGPNALQNFPLLTAASSSSSGVTEITGTLNSAADRQYRIEFFYSNPGDVSGHGEASTYIGTTNVRTDGSGNAPIRAVLHGVALLAGGVVSATATELPAAGGFGSTSELSQNVTLTAANELIVDTTSDAADGNTSSIANLLASRGADGRISLREAIQASNNTANSGGPDRILFAIPTSDPNYDAGTGVFTLTLGSLLPTLNEGTIVDGTTQAQNIGDTNAGTFGTGGLVGVDDLTLSTVARPEIELVDGASLAQGLHVNGSGVSVLGLAIHGFTNDLSLGSQGDDALIEGNLLGLAAQSAADPGAGQRASANLYALNTTGGVLRNNLVGYADYNSVEFGSGSAGWRIENNEFFGGGYLNPAYDSLVLFSGGSFVIGNRFSGSPGSGIDISGGITARLSNNTISNIGYAPSSEHHAVWANANAVVEFDRNRLLASPYTGIEVTTGAQVVISRNSISGSSELGIDLNGDGHTNNDAGDADTGPNQLQNHPVLTAATSTGGNTTITGSLSSAASSSYRVEFFSSPSANVSGYGEGQTYLGSIDVLTNGSGTAAINVVLTGVSISAGHVVSSTATFLSGGNTPVYTSEFSASVTASGNVLTVDTTSDAADGNTSSIASLLASRGADGKISLREAIEAANNTANLGGPDLIRFEIPDALVGGAHTITPLSSLPTLTDAVVIDGGTDVDFAGTPVIVIDGNGLAGNGLTVNGGNSTIRGLVVSRFGASGIAINSAGGNTIAGNYIGTDVTGNLDRGNTGAGLYIGTAGNTIGGTSTADRNVISGNDGRGIDIAGAAATANQVLGNYIGLNSAGNAALGNGNVGVEISGGAHHNAIGGTTAGARNVVSGNGWVGVEVSGGGSNANQIFGNYIGTDASGTSAIGNTGSGVSLFSGVSGNQVGGPTAAHRNIVSGNAREGVYIGITSNANLVLGNYIGVDATGTAPLGNAFDGVRFEDSVHSNTVGGVNPGEGNVIAFNAERGVNFLANAGALNTILGNSIHSNTLQGIDLGNDGITANDVFDSDVGANALQNFPVINDVTSSGGNTSIYGTLVSTGSTDYRIEFFSSPSADAGGNGEGQTFLGATNLTTDAGGNAVINTTLTGVSVTPGHFVSATATVDIGGGYYGNTSEFSTSMPVSSNTLVVDTTSDVSDGNTASIAALLASRGGDGRISLREAIEAANNTVNGTGADQIRFSIADPLVSGAHTISVSSPLPAITDALTIDGSTEPDFAATPVVALDGVSAGAGVDGLLVAASGSTVRGLSIQRFSDSGIRVLGATGVVIEGNYLGVGVDGATDRSNTMSGIRIDGGSANQVGGDSAAERNVIIASGGQAVGLLNATAGNFVTGNYIGTNAAGSTVLGTTLTGVHFFGTTGAGNRIGGTAAGESNVIAGSYAGVDVQSGAQLVQGNIIGLNAAQTAAIGGTSMGVAVYGSGSQIGGTVAGAGNVLSGNGVGLALAGGGASSNLVAGNFVGTNSSGTTAFGNSIAGIDVSSGASSNTIGGNTVAARNLVSGNAGAGVRLQGAATTGNVIDGNYIGTDAAGTGALGNGGDGVRLETGASSVRIGDAASPNLIAFNLGNGVSLASDAGSLNRLYSIIHSNGGLAIDLGDDGVSANDANDVDSGPNGLQNFPVLMAANTTGADLVVSGTIDSAPLTSYRITFFANGSADASGHGEAQTLLGVHLLSTDAAGDAAFIWTTNTAVAAGTTISSRLEIDYGGGVFADFSEMSQNVTAATPGISVSQSPPLNTSESGTNTTFTVALDSRPAADVTIPVSSSDPTEGTASVSMLTFTPANWNSAQVVTVTGVDDGLVDGVQAYSIVFGAAVSADPSYNGAVAGDIGYTNTDNDLYNELVVTTENDLVNGNTSSVAALITSDGGDGISLREAILAANNTANAGGNPDHIHFNIAGGGLRSIEPTSALPAITDAVYIDGFTQPGSSVNTLANGTNALLRVQLYGISAGPAVDGLVLAAGSAGSTITGLAILSFSDSGIQIESANNFILGNHIGTSASGLLDFGNGGNGIHVLGGGNNQIGSNALADRNVISGNEVHGVLIDSANGTLVLGNLIGTDASGAAALGNTQDGVTLVGNSIGNQVGGNTAGSANVISGNQHGVHLSGGAVQGNTVSGNRIGTDASGVAALGNSLDGIVIDAGAFNNLVGGASSADGNLISGNLRHGVDLNSVGTTGNGLYSNLVGLNAAGTAAIGNGANGIWHGLGASGTFIGAAGIGNTISGNLGNGIVIEGPGVTSVTVSGNRVGTNTAGTAAVGNANAGVFIGNAAGNNIGGTGPGDGNLISGNATSGIGLFGDGATANTVRGNLIGLNAAGTAAIGNNVGIAIDDADNNMIGGTTAGAANVVSGNLADGVSIYLDADSNQVIGNLIGTDPAGIAALGNGSYGVFLVSGAGSNVIGGAVAGSSNSIAFNAAAGIAIAASAGSDNFLNSLIWSNGGLAIDLNDDGVTANDPLDADAGVNGLLNFPVIGSATTNGSQITIVGTIDSLPSTALRITFFANDAADPSGHGEAQTYLGLVDLSTDGAGHAAFAPTFAVSVPAGQFISARAHADLGGGVFGDTSEMAASMAAIAPGITVTPSVGLTTTEAGGTAAFDVVLNSAPSSNVVIALSSSDTTEGTVSTASLTFTTGNWSTPQTVVVTGVDDPMADGDIAYAAVTAAAVSLDPVYSGLNAADVALMNTNDDVVNTLVVTNSNDTVNGDTSSISALVAAQGGDGISLREAITAANNTINAGSGADLIRFSIADPLVTGEHRIMLAAALPSITDAVQIDGSTEPDFTGMPVVVLDGSTAGAGADGVRLFAGSGGSTIRGLGVNGFASDGILIAVGSDANVIAGNHLWGQSAAGITAQSAGNRIGGTALADRNWIDSNGGSGITLSGAPATGNLVQGNHIGVDASGLTDLGNGGDGVRIVSGASNNTIGGAINAARNLISGNEGAGVRLDGAGTQGNQVMGNWIGVDATGNAALGNTLDAVLLINSPGPNTIGGLTAAEGNVLSGNLRDGVNINAGATGVLVLNNLIGLGADGNTAVGNGRYGVQITAASTNTIGLTGAGNVISANAQNGVLITTASSGNSVSGNRIGTDATGLLARGNQSDGIGIQNAATGNVIGGVANGNQIAGNLRHGVFISDAGTDNNEVSGNHIGLDATGLAALGNAVDGILVSISAAGTRIGQVGAGNVVSGNLGDGIQINSSVTGTVVIANIVGLGSDGNTNVGNGAYGVSVTNSSSGNTIGGAAPGEGNTVSGNGLHGILVTLGADNNTVIGNRVGTDSSGTLARPNEHYGVYVSNAVNVRIGGTGAGEGNLISGNGVGGGYAGIGLASATAPIVQGNRIGTTADGLASLANNGDGIAVSNTTNAQIGGASAAARNLISGNTAYGIQVSGASATGNQIQGNWVGTDVTGLAGLANGLAGILINGAASNNLIGGSAPNEGNVVSGNNLRGVYLSGPGTDANSVLGNWIGLGADGTTVVANIGSGVLVNNNTSGNRIGDAGSGNVIAGNSVDGVRINTSASGNLVRGNWIGTDASATLALGNGSDGVQIDASSGNTVGGVLAGQGNVITNNLASGVAVTGGGSGNLVIGNALFANAGLGIDLAGDGLSADDALDADAGDNALQNHGTLVIASAGGGQLWLQGQLQSAPLGNYRVAVYASGSADPSGFGEGERFVGYADVATDAGGLAELRFSLPAPGVAVGEQITITVTDLVSGDTSEFSNSVAAQTPAIVVTPLGANTTTEAGGTASYTLALNHATTFDVVVPLSVSAAAEATVSLANVTFGPANWHLTQTVTLTGQQDFVTDGDTPYQWIIGAAVSADPIFGGLDTPDVTLVNLESPNTAPVLGAPGAQVIDEDMSLTFSVANGTAISLTDADSGTQPMQLTLTFTNPALGSTMTLASTVGLSFVSGDGVADTTLITRGSRADLLAALDGLTVNPAAHANGADGLVITVDDQGNTGSGGPLLASAIVPIIVNAINDAPTVVAPAVLAIDEDSPVVFSVANGNAIVLADADSGSADIELRLQADRGMLTLARTDGLVLIEGTGSGDGRLVARATAAALNAAIAGLTFVPEENFFGTARLHVDVDDLGQAGAAAAPSLTGSAAIDIAIAAVNDAPRELARAPAVVLVEGQPQHTSAGTIVPDDPDDVSGFVFELVEDASHFRIDGASGELTVSVLTLPDAVVRSSYQIIVRVSDPQGAFLDRSFVIQVVPKTVTPPPAPPREVGTPAPLASAPPNNNSVQPVAGNAAETAAAGSRVVGAAGDSADIVDRRRPPNLMHGIRSSRNDEGSVARSSRAAAEEERRAQEMSSSLGLGSADTTQRRAFEFKRAFELLRFDRLREAIGDSGASGVLRQQIRLPGELFQWAPETQKSRDFSVSLEVAQVGGGVVSLGLLVYALRAGGLVAAMLTALPAWSSLDPLVVLGKEKDSARRSTEWDDELATEMAVDEAGVRDVIGRESRFSSTVVRH